MIGKTVAQYRILDKLGQGGMGVVYRAEDTNLKRTVALKFLLPRALGGGEERTRFIHEARAAASLNHPNICTVHEIGEYEGEPFIAMEFVEGRSLSSLIAEGPLKLDRAVDVAKQVAEGLNEAHANGVVHRDIKSDNIMVTDAGRVKIMDFGLAAAVGQTRLTREGTTVGTVAYMSPEQTRGERIDGRSDIWSLGAVMYEMIAGRQPFAGDHPQALMYAIVNEEPQPPTAVRTGVPMELERIVLKALEKRPDDRYQHADDLLSDLRRVERAGTGGTRGTTDRVRAKGPRRRRAVAAVVVVAVVVVGYMVLRPLMEEQQLVAAPKPIAVIGFENLSGDPQYDYLSKAIPNLLITSLEQSRYLRVTTWERMRDLAEQLGRERVEDIDEALGFELCRLDDIEVVVTGSFVKAGNTFATDVKVLDVATKEMIASASARGGGVESILDSQVDELSEAIARGVGLSRGRIEQTQRPVAEVTTTSMEAYNYYLRGVEEYDKFYYDDARRFLERAVAIDSTFAMAYVYLASTYGYLRDRVSRDEMYERAMRYAEHTTERERLHIESRYATVIEDDQEKKRRLLQELVRKYPKEKRGYLYLAMDARDEDRHQEAVEYLQKTLVLDPAFAPALNMLGYEHLYARNYDEALEYLERYAAASPGDANPFDSMGEVYLGMGELEQSIAKYREAVEVKPDFFGAKRNIAYVYGVMGEYDSARVWVDRYMDTAPTPGLRLSGYEWRSLFLFLTGQVDEAFADIERFQAIQTSNTRYSTSANHYLKGHYLCGTGRYAPAEQAFNEWHNTLDRLYPEQPRTNEKWSTTQLALVYAGWGRVDDAVAAIDRAHSLQPEVAIEQIPNSSLLIEGEVLLAAGRVDDAIELVGDSLRMRIPTMGSEVQVLVHNFPLDGDVLARAYLAKGDLDSAAAEYRKLIELHPESNNRRLRNPIYHYRLGKVYERMGRPADAAEQYQRFLHYWRHADPDLDEYVYARGRLRALGGERKEASE
jgi:tetratricopeptide (TPR) repeat protein/predicted Ser/Thr protein kinase